MFNKLKIITDIFYLMLLLIYMYANNAIRKTSIKSKKRSLCYICCYCQT